MRPSWILSADRREVLAYEQGVKDGLRRAQELAKEHTTWSRASGRVILAEHFNHAIDAEVAKEGK